MLTTDPLLALQCISPTRGIVNCQVEEFYMRPYMVNKKVCLEMKHFYWIQLEILTEDDALPLLSLIFF